MLVQSGDGKGQAVREALEYITVPYVVMLDGDGTYDPADADTMLEPLSRGYEHVIGNRFADMDDDAMRALNGVGNRLINRAFGFVHGANYEDILSGYRAFTADSFRRFSLDSDGFTIETELAVECVKHGVETTVVPISYSARPDESETNLHPVKDGGTILLALYSLAKTNNPLFYFGSLGMAGIVSGGFIAVYVLWEWLRYQQGHEIMALVSAAAILLGVQLLMFGVLSDMLVTLHREQRRRSSESLATSATSECAGARKRRNVTTASQPSGRSKSSSEREQGADLRDDAARVVPAVRFERVVELVQQFLPGVELLRRHFGEHFAQRHVVPVYVVGNALVAEFGLDVVFRGRKGQVGVPEMSVDGSDAELDTVGFFVVSARWWPNSHACTSRYGADYKNGLDTTGERRRSP